MAKAIERDVSSRIVYGEEGGGANTFAARGGHDVFMFKVAFGPHLDIKLRLRYLGQQTVSTA